MKPLRLSIKRLLRVAIVFGKYRLDRLIPLGPDLSLLLKMALLPLRVRTAPHPNVGVDLKLALIELGPAFIKLGQLLSTRRDLLPNDIADALETLQDQVPAFESEVAVALIETSLERPLAGIFKHFDPKPLASASIAQVHTAELDSGESVVIKIRRPDITERVLEDLQILESLAALTDRRWTQAQARSPEYDQASSTVARSRQTLRTQNIPGSNPRKPSGHGTSRGHGSQSQRPVDRSRRQPRTAGQLRR